LFGSRKDALSLGFDTEAIDVVQKLASSISLDENKFKPNSLKIVPTRFLGKEIITEKLRNYKCR
jgi:hypothetical protein